MLYLARRKRATLFGGAGTPWTPALLSPDQWYAKAGPKWADAGRTIPSSVGGIVRTWDDVAGGANARHQQAAADGSSALLQADGSLLFDGTDDAYVRAAPDVVTSQPFTFLFRALIASDAGVGIREWGSVNSAVVWNQGGDLYFYAGSFIQGPTITLNAWHTVVFCFNGAASYIRADGVQSAALNPGTSGGATVVALGFNANGYFKGQIKEVIKVPAVLSAQNLALVEAYLGGL